VENPSVKKRKDQELFMQPFFRTESERKGGMQFCYQGKLKERYSGVHFFVKLRLYTYSPDALQMQFRVKPASFSALLLNNLG